MIVWVLLVVASGCSKRTAQIPQPFTTPIPVPQPAVERVRLSPELQALWERVELAVDVRPPDPPDDATEMAVEQWADGPFKDWLLQRRTATDHALQAAFSMRPLPQYERAVASALFGYMYEDMASSIRGAPVPDNIAEDEGLLKIYLDSLTEHLQPFALLSAKAYYACIALFAKDGDVSWWEWVRYCDQRGSEVVDTFDLVPPEPDEPATLF